MSMNQKAYWDKAASEKEFTTPFQMDQFKLHVTQSSAILDVGCGYGRTLNELYQAGFRNIRGIDFSQQMIERATQLYPCLDLKRYSTRFPFENNTFDAVLLIAVLTCMVKDEDQIRTIREIQRVLKPGGILYVNEFLISTDARNLDRYNAFKDRYGTYGVFELDEGALLRHHTEAHLFELMQGFKTQVFQPLVYTTMNRHTARGCYYIGKKNE